MIVLHEKPRFPEGTIFSEVLFEVNKLNGRFLAEVDKLVQPFGLTNARWKVLGVISLSALPLTVPQIGRRIGFSRQNVQRLVDVMEHEGFVEYQENPDHKRAKLVYLTKKGQQQYAAIMRVHIPWANRCAGGIKRADLDRTLMVLKKLTSQLNRA